MGMLPEVTLCIINPRKEALRRRCQERHSNRLPFSLARCRSLGDRAVVVHDPSDKGVGPSLGVLL